MLNKCSFIGNLGADPEIRSLASGERVANLRLAVTERWTKNGEKQERTEWIRVAIFNDRIADVADKYCHKGSKLYIEGALQTRKYTDQQGQERFSTEIVIGRFNGSLVLLDSRGSGATEEAPIREPAAAKAPAREAPRGKVPTSDLDEEIPF